ncbi:MAG: protease complex subunit PrcB family protein [Planctomycetes bacterium]|nr:protease complex subunit PrcB family protein [Planctomycetota bacterium]
MLTSLLLAVALGSPAVVDKTDSTKQRPRLVPVPVDKIDPALAAALAKVRPLEFKLAVDDKTKEKQLKIQARGGGYSVEILGVEMKDKTLTVRWKLNSPGPDSIVTQAFTHPAQAVLVDTAEGEPKFVEETKK